MESQTIADWLEIIVIDDGSKDSTAEIANSFDIRYFYQENQGNGMAKREGVNQAKGEFLSFLDQDDYYTPDKISVQVGYLLENPHLGFVVCNMRYLLEPGCSIPPHLNEADFTKDIASYIPGAMLVRKNVFDKVGNFDPDLHEANDMDWLFRAKDAGIKMENVNRTLLYKRIHDANLSNVRSMQSRGVREMLKTVRKSVERKQN